mmetsp:Transcript_17862/g.23536  ORF Transcript_17862/g.23536 Transcript_17862/m.23536 type:complete len:454 (+) Transcript_17862:83-1444(+)
MVFKIKSKIKAIKDASSIVQRSQRKLSFLVIKRKETLALCWQFTHTHLFQTKYSVRMAKQCAICWNEPKPFSDSIRCSSKDNHVLCDECFLDYVQNLEASRVRDNNGFLPCPACGEIFENVLVAKLFVRRDNYKPLVKYLDMLQGDLPCNRNRYPLSNSLDYKQNVLRILANILLELLNIRCPNPTCNFTLDPFPDACRAMRCENCSCDFCWVCLEILENKRAAHKHVAETHGGDVFVPQDEVDCHHFRLRCRTIRKFWHDFGMDGDNAKHCREDLLKIMGESGILDDENLRNFIRYLPPSKGSSFVNKQAIVNVFVVAPLGAVGSRSVKMTTAEKVANAVYGFLGYPTKSILEKSAEQAIYGSVGGALLWDTAMVLNDIGRCALTAFEDKDKLRDMQKQILRRLQNAIINASAQSVGAYMGTLLYPGVGTYLGSLLAGTVAACIHQPVQKKR